MIDIDAVRKRISQPVPTKSPTPKGDLFWAPTPEWLKHVETDNRWLDEWRQDRTDLRVALDELEELRQAHPGPYR